MAVSVFASFRPLPERSGEFLDAMGTMVRSSRTEPGCLRYDLYESEPAARYHLFEVYADSDALKAHRGSAHYRQYRRTVPGMLAGPIDVVVLEPIDVQA